MNRAELERLDRDTLIVRAEEAGVARARILTRPELVDELLLRSASDEPGRRKARGLFGLARDLLARVVERGLHLPDAADRIRTLTAPPPSRPSAPAALPTVTLAEIYATQGHRGRAIETLENVLAREPEHAAARALLAQLDDEAYAGPSPRLPPEPEGGPVGSSVAPEADEDVEPAGAAPPQEPQSMLDAEPLPDHYDVDECVGIPVDPTTLFVYWEVRRETVEAMHRARPEASLCLRVVAVAPTWDGPLETTFDQPVDAWVGDWFFRGLPAGSIARAAIGWTVRGSFVPVAHSPALEAAPEGPSPIVADVLVRWTPAGLTPVRASDPDAASIDRALTRVRRESARAREAELEVEAHGYRGDARGTSERWASAGA